MFYLLILIVGIGLIVFAAITYRRGLTRYRSASTSWKQGTATIEQSWLELVEHTTNDSSTISYRARVAYRYVAEGVEHNGIRPFLCSRVNFRSELSGKQWLAGVPAGATVPVWYNPSKASDAALELNRPSLTLVTVVGPAGAVFAAAGLFMLMKH